MQYLCRGHLDRCPFVWPKHLGRQRRSRCSAGGFWCDGDASTRSLALNPSSRRVVLSSRSVPFRFASFPPAVNLFTFLSVKNKYKKKAVQAKQKWKKNRDAFDHFFYFFFVSTVQCNVSNSLLPPNPQRKSKSICIEIKISCHCPTTTTTKTTPLKK